MDKWADYCIVGVHFASDRKYVEYLCTDANPIAGGDPGDLPGF